MRDTIREYPFPTTLRRATKLSEQDASSSKYDSALTELIDTHYPDFDGCAGDTDGIGFYSLHQINREWAVVMMTTSQGFVYSEICTTAEAEQVLADAEPQQDDCDGED